MKIAICEDSAFEANCLRKQVLMYFNNRRKDAEIEIFYSGSKLMAAHEREKSYDFYFLDITLGSNMDGIELGKVLRKYFPSVNIVFVTGHNNHYADAMRIHAFDYLVKPIKNKAICKLFDEYFNSLDDFNKPSIVINHHYQQKRLIQGNILYVTKMEQQNQIIYHTTYEDISEYGSLKTALEKLDVRFAQVNRKTIVNLCRVEYIDKGHCCMDNDLKIKIGRSYNTEIRKKFIDLNMED